MPRNQQGRMAKSVSRRGLAHDVAFRRLIGLRLAFQNRMPLDTLALGDDRVIAKHQFRAVPALWRGRQCIGRRATLRHDKTHGNANSATLGRGAVIRGGSHTKMTGDQESSVPESVSLGILARHGAGQTTISANDAVEDDASADPGDERRLGHITTEILGTWPLQPGGRQQAWRGSWINRPRPIVRGLRPRRRRPAKRQDRANGHYRTHQPLPIPLQHHLCTPPQHRSDAHYGPYAPRSHPKRISGHLMNMKRALFSSPQLAVSVCSYPPGERHGRHADAFSRVSFVVRGGYREENRAGAIAMRPGDVLVKSQRAFHEDEFGEAGATLVALEFLTLDPFDAPGATDLWRRRTDGFALRHANAFLSAALEGDLEGASAAGVDLVSACLDDDTRRMTPPAWMKSLKLELEERRLADVSVSQRAHEAGAHPAHASRLFRQCYGQSITEYAQAQSVRRALSSLAESPLALSEIALSAGFYDQSHMSRVFRRVIGRTPRQQRALLAAAC